MQRRTLDLAALTEAELKRQLQDAVLRLLSRREHSRGELQRKLTQRGYPSEAVQRMLEYAAAEGWQSDERFVASYARQQLEQGSGARKIAAALSQRGVANELIQAWLTEQDIDWAEQAYQKLVRRFGETPATDLKEKQKRQRFLQQRGFSFSAINSALTRQESASTD